MFFKRIKSSKIFLFMIFSLLQYIENSNAGWKDFVEEGITITIKSLPKAPAKERRETLIEIFSQQKVTLFDLSSSDVNDEDLADVAYGLAQRSKNPNHFPLKFLDISNKYISKEGVENLLINCEKGIKVDEKNETPDIRETVMKVSFNVTNVLHARWCEKAPTIFSNGLTLLQ